MAGTLFAVPAISRYVGGGYSFGALPAALCANVFVTGLNQLADIEVDKLNKPHLPLASGAMTTAEARQIVAAAGTVALVASSLSPFLSMTCTSSMVLGALYSVGPVRLKRFPPLAALSIAVVRGVVVNVGFASHALQTLTIPVGPVAFFSTLGLAIALLKDVPDYEGDQRTGTPSFAIRHGRAPVVLASAALVSLALLCVAITTRKAQSCALLMTLFILHKTTTLLRNDTHQAAVQLYKSLWAVFVASYAGMYFI